MSRKHPVYGTCHICGQHKKLSFEHVPPEKAFNNQPARYANLLDIIEGEGPNRPIKTRRYSQRGLGDYTLCEQCNNDTGAWYAHDFALWCYQGMDILVRSDFNPKLIYLHQIYPLRVVKQIATMMFSVCSAKFQSKHPDLVKFVLNKEWRYLSPEYRFFAYFNIEGILRMIGNEMVVGKFDFSTGLGGRVFRMHEISYPPFGYVMTLSGQDPIDSKLVDITHFTRYWYDELENAPLYLPVLPTELPIPGDYRTRAQIDKESQENTAEAEASRGERLAS